MATKKEIRDKVIAEIIREVNDHLDNHYEKIMEYVEESDSQSATIGFRVVLNCKNKDITTKTHIAYSQINKDVIEGVIGDPDQPEFEEVVEDAKPKKKSTPKKKDSGKDA